MPDSTSTATTDPLVAAALDSVEANAVQGGVWVARLTNGRHLLITEPAAVDVYGIARDAADWADALTDQQANDLASQVYRLIEEAGVAAGSKRQPTEDAARLHHKTMNELADRALLALVAIESCGADAGTVMARAAGQLAAKMGLPQQPAIDPR